MNIKVLGSGCKSCKKLFNEVEVVVNNLEMNSNVEYVTDLSKIMEYGIINFPALVIDNEIVSAGKVLSAKEIQNILINSELEKFEEHSCSCSCCCEDS